MKLTKLAAYFAAATMLVACGSDDDDDNDGYTNTQVQNVLNTNADIALAAYEDSVETAKALQKALADFKADKTEANLEAAKKAWLVSREPYGQTEVYRFRNSPIDSTNYKDEDGPEGDINAWPLGEALIDYVKVNSTDFGDDQIGVTAHEAGDDLPAEIDVTNAAGNNIIETTSITINEALISNTATADDEHDVIAGYHAIEFLLWGQDLNTTNQAATDGTDRDEAVNTGVMGGQRPLSDFTTDANADRRHQYLEVAAAKLVADLEQVRDGWKEGADYRKAFTTINSDADANQRLTEILTGMGTLSEGELAGERMQIAYVGNSQEDEHSCFSDNTHRDVVLNALGVANSYYGEYKGYDSNLDGKVDNTTRAVNGYGFDDYLADTNRDALNTSVKAALKVTETGYNKIDDEARNNNRPFDVLIMDANRNSANPVYQTIIALNAQSVEIQKVATELGLGEVVDEEASECNTQDPNSDC